MNKSLAEVVARFFYLLDIQEESDNGIAFRPNILKINSCRVMDGLELEECLKVMRELSENISK